MSKIVYKPNQIINANSNSTVIVDVKDPIRDFVWNYSNRIGKSIFVWRVRNYKQPFESSVILDSAPQYEYKSKDSILKPLTLKDVTENDIGVYSLCYFKLNEMVEGVDTTYAENYSVIYEFTLLIRTTIKSVYATEGQSYQFAFPNTIPSRQSHIRWFITRQRYPDQEEKILKRINEMRKESISGIKSLPERLKSVANKKTNPLLSSRRWNRSAALSIWYMVLYGYDYTQDNKRYKEIISQLKKIPGRVINVSAGHPSQDKDSLVELSWRNIWSRAKVWYIELADTGIMKRKPELAYFRMHILRDIMAMYVPLPERHQREFEIFTGLGSNASTITIQHLSSRYHTGLICAEAWNKSNGEWETKAVFQTVVFPVPRQAKLPLNYNKIINLEKYIDDPDRPKGALVYNNQWIRFTLSSDDPYKSGEPKTISLNSVTSRKFPFPDAYIDTKTIPSNRLTKIQRLLINERSFYNMERISSSIINAQSQGLNMDNTDQIPYTNTGRGFNIWPTTSQLLPFAAGYLIPKQPIPFRYKIIVNKIIAPPLTEQGNRNNKQIAPKSDVYIIRLLDPPRQLRVKIPLFYYYGLYPVRVRGGVDIKMIYPSRKIHAKIGSNVNIDFKHILPTVITGMGALKLQPGYYIQWTKTHFNGNSQELTFNRDQLMLNVINIKEGSQARYTMKMLYRDTSTTKTIIAMVIDSHIIVDVNCARCGQGYDPDQNIFGSCQWHTNKPRLRYPDQRTNNMNIQNFLKYKGMSANKTTIGNLLNTLKNEVGQGKYFMVPVLKNANQTVSDFISHLETNGIIPRTLKSKYIRSRISSNREIAEEFDHASYVHSINIGDLLRNKLLPEMSIPRSTHKPWEIVHQLLNGAKPLTIQPVTMNNTLTQNILTSKQVLRPAIYHGMITDRVEQKYTANEISENHKPGMWACCRRSSSHPGCWIDKHRHDTSSPTPSNVLSTPPIRGSKNISEPNTSDIIWNNMLKLKREGRIMDTLELENRYNAIHGAVLKIPYPFSSSRVWSLVTQEMKNMYPGVESYLTGYTKNLEGPMALNMFINFLIFKSELERVWVQGYSFTYWKRDNERLLQYFVGSNIQPLVQQSPLIYVIAMLYKMGGNLDKYLRSNIRLSVEEIPFIDPLHKGPLKKTRVKKKRTVSLIERVHNFRQFVLRGKTLTGATSVDILNNIRLYFNESVKAYKKKPIQYQHVLTAIGTVQNNFYREASVIERLFLQYENQLATIGKVISQFQKELLKTNKLITDAEEYKSLVSGKPSRETSWIFGVKDTIKNFKKFKGLKIKPLLTIEQEITYIKTEISDFKTTIINIRKTYHESIINDIKNAVDTINNLAKYYSVLDSIRNYILNIGQKSIIITAENLFINPTARKLFKSIPRSVDFTPTKILMSIQSFNTVNIGARVKQGSDNSVLRTYTEATRKLQVLYTDPSKNTSLASKIIKHDGWLRGLLSQIKLQTNKNTVNTKRVNAIKVLLANQYITNNEFIHEQFNIDTTEVDIKERIKVFFSMFSSGGYFSNLQRFVTNKIGRNQSIRKYIVAQLPKNFIIPKTPEAIAKMYIDWNIKQKRGIFFSKNYMKMNQLHPDILTVLRQSHKELFNTKRTGLVGKTIMQEIEDSSKELLEGVGFLSNIEKYSLMHFDFGLFIHHNINISQSIKSYLVSKRIKDLKKWEDFGKLKNNTNAPKLLGIINGDIRYKELTKKFILLFDGHLKTHIIPSINKIYGDMLNGDKLYKNSYLNEGKAMNTFIRKLININPLYTGIKPPLIPFISHIVDFVDRLKIIQKEVRYYLNLFKKTQPFLLWAPKKPDPSVNVNTFINELNSIGKGRYTIQQEIIKMDSVSLYPFTGKNVVFQYKQVDENKEIKIEDPLFQYMLPIWKYYEHFVKVIQVNNSPLFKKFVKIKIPTNVGQKDELNIYHNPIYYVVSLVTLTSPTKIHVYWDLFSDLYMRLFETLQNVSKVITEKKILERIVELENNLFNFKKSIIVTFGPQIDPRNNTNNLYKKISTPIFKFMNDIYSIKELGGKKRIDKLFQEQFIYSEVMLTIQQLINFINIATDKEKIKEYFALVLRQFYIGKFYEYHIEQFLSPSNTIILNQFSKIIDGPKYRSMYAKEDPLFDPDFNRVYSMANAGTTINYEGTMFYLYAMYSDVVIPNIKSSYNIPPVDNKTWVSAYMDKELRSTQFTNPKKDFTLTEYMSERLNVIYTIQKLFGLKEITFVGYVFDHIHSGGQLPEPVQLEQYLKFSSTKMFKRYSEFVLIFIMNRWLDLYVRPEFNKHFRKKDIENKITSLSKKDIGILDKFPNGIDNVVRKYFEQRRHNFVDEFSGFWVQLRSHKKYLNRLYLPLTIKMKDMRIHNNIFKDKPLNQSLYRITSQPNINMLLRYGKSKFKNSRKKTAKNQEYTIALEELFKTTMWPDVYFKIDKTTSPSHHVYTDVYAISNMIMPLNELLLDFNAQKIGRVITMNNFPQWRFSVAKLYGSAYQRAMIEQHQTLERVIPINRISYVKPIKQQTKGLGFLYDNSRYIAKIFLTFILPTLSDIKDMESGGDFFESKKLMMMSCLNSDFVVKDRLQNENLLVTDEIVNWALGFYNKFPNHFAANSNRKEPIKLEPITIGRKDIPLGETYNLHERVEVILHKVFNEINKKPIDRGYDNLMGIFMNEKNTIGKTTGTTKNILTPLDLLVFEINNYLDRLGIIRNKIFKNGTVGSYKKNSHASLVDEYLVPSKFEDFSRYTQILYTGSMVDHMSTPTIESIKIMFPGFKNFTPEFEEFITLKQNINNHIELLLTIFIYCSSEKLNGVELENFPSSNEILKTIFDEHIKQKPSNVFYEMHESWLELTETLFFPKDNKTKLVDDFSLKSVIDTPLVEILLSEYDIKNTKTYGHGRFSLEEFQKIINNKRKSIIGEYHKNNNNFIFYLLYGRLYFGAEIPTSKKGTKVMKIMYDAIQPPHLYNSLGFYPRFHKYPAMSDIDLSVRALKRFNLLLSVTKSRTSIIVKGSTTMLTSKKEKNTVMNIPLSYITFEEMMSKHMEYYANSSIIDKFVMLNFELESNQKIKNPSPQLTVYVKQWKQVLRTLHGKVKSGQFSKQQRIAMDIFFKLFRNAVGHRNMSINTLRFMVKYIDLSGTPHSITFIRNPNLNQQIGKNSHRNTKWIMHDPLLHGSKQHNIFSTYKNTYEMEISVLELLVESIQNPLHDKWQYIRPQYFILIFESTVNDYVSASRSRNILTQLRPSVAKFQKHTDIQVPKNKFMKLREKHYKNLLKNIPGSYNKFITTNNIFDITKATPITINKNNGDIGIDKLAEAVIEGIINNPVSQQITKSLSLFDEFKKYLNNIILPYLKLQYLGILYKLHISDLGYSSTYVLDKTTGEKNIGIKWINGLITDTTEVLGLDLLKRLNNRYINVRLSSTYIPIQSVLSDYYETESPIFKDIVLPKIENFKQNLKKDMKRIDTQKTFYKYLNGFLTKNYNVKTGLYNFFANTTILTSKPQPNKLIDGEPILTKVKLGTLGLSSSEERKKIRNAMSLIKNKDGKLVFGKLITILEKIENSIGYISIKSPFTGFTLSLGGIMDEIKKNGREINKLITKYIKTLNGELTTKKVNLYNDFIDLYNQYYITNSGKMTFIQWTENAKLYNKSSKQLPAGNVHVDLIDKKILFSDAVNKIIGNPKYKSYMKIMGSLKHLLIYNHNYGGNGTYNNHAMSENIVKTIFDSTNGLSTFISSIMDKSFISLQTNPILKFKPMVRRSQTDISNNGKFLDMKKRALFKPLYSTNTTLESNDTIRVPYWYSPTKTTKHEENMSNIEFNILKNAANKKPIYPVKLDTVIYSYLGILSQLIYVHDIFSSEGTMNIINKFISNLKNKNQASGSYIHINPEILQDNIFSKSVAYPILNVSTDFMGADISQIISGFKVIFKEKNYTKITTEISNIMVNYLESLGVFTEHLHYSGLKISNFVGKINESKEKKTTIKTITKTTVTTTDLDIYGKYIENSFLKRYMSQFDLTVPALAIRERYFFSNLIDSEKFRTGITATSPNNTDINTHLRRLFLHTLHFLVRTVSTGIKDRKPFNVADMLLSEIHLIDHLGIMKQVDYLNILRSVILQNIGFDEFKPAKDKLSLSLAAKSENIKKKELYFMMGKITGWKSKIKGGSNDRKINKHFVEFTWIKS